MPKLTINDQEVIVEDGTSILQACESIGIEVPRFCFHDRLSVPANCRMCLVEVEKAPKLMASCALPCAEGMVVKTNNERVAKARKGVMEFLLMNHPLDCPICDQGGECDLQDQAMGYGQGTGRYDEVRREVSEKELGPLIKTVMTRCIHCTRCIRFSDEISGMTEMGATDRGEHMEIGPYIEKNIVSELSGNMIDVCPVGALTSKPYAFKARSWELNEVESIDVMDGVGSNIHIGVRGMEVMRILPRLHEGINEEWISDKTRFFYDGLKVQRLDQPYLKKNGKLIPVQWGEALSAAADKLLRFPASEIAAIAGPLVDAESLFAFKSLMDAIGTPHLECRQEGTIFNTACRASYLFNTSIEAIEEADAILMIGTNPRYEATLVNARIRKNWLANQLPIAMVGDPVDLTYSYDYLGHESSILEKILSGKHAFSKKLKTAKKPMIILGAGALGGVKEGPYLQLLAAKIAEKFDGLTDKWCGYNMLQLEASRTGALDLNFLPQGKTGKDLKAILKGVKDQSIRCVYLLGADEIEAHKLDGAFVIYQGHHGDRGAHMADIILPSPAFTEKEGRYVNLEGRVQKARKATAPVGDAKEDWKIFKALSIKMAKVLPFNTKKELERGLIKAFPHMKQLDLLAENPSKALLKWLASSKVTSGQTLSLHAFHMDYYLTNPILRASRIMADCTEAFDKHLKNAMARPDSKLKKIAS